VPTRLSREAFEGREKLNFPVVFDVKNRLFDIEKRQLDVEISFFDVEKTQLDIEISFFDIEKT
jgi:hypothetical protein